MKLFFTETGSLTPQLTTFNPKENCTLLLMGWPLKMHHLPLNWVYRKSKIHTLTCGQGFGRRGERSHQVQKWRFSCSCVESDQTTEPQKQVEMDCRERKERWRKEGEKCFREDASAWKISNTVRIPYKRVNGGCLLALWGGRHSRETDIQ